MYLFIAQNGEVSPGFTLGGFFFFFFYLEGRDGRGGRGALSLQIFGRFAQGSAETVHFLGVSSLGNWVKKNCILSNDFHYLSVYLFIIIIYLVCVNYAHPCLFDVSYCKFKLTWNKESHYILQHSSATDSDGLIFEVWLLVTLWLNKLTSTWSRLLFWLMDVSAICGGSGSEHGWIVS